MTEIKGKTCARTVNMLVYFIKLLLFTIIILGTENIRMKKDIL